MATYFLCACGCGERAPLTSDGQGHELYYSDHKNRERARAFREEKKTLLDNDKKRKAQQHLRTHPLPRCYGRNRDNIKVGPKLPTQTIIANFGRFKSAKG